MDPRERLNDPEEAFRAGVGGLLAGLWTALPCVVNSVNFTAMTVTLQPTIMAKQRAEDGTVKDVKLPLLLDVPIIFMGGGGFVFTFPIAAGDEALAIFASRCIDSWWQSGGIQAQAELRMHDLSDAFCLVGPRAKPNAVPDVNPATAQLRTNDGTCYVELAGGGVINMVAPTKIHMTTPLLEVTGDVVGGTISLRNHVHSEVQTGADNTGLPVP